MSRAIRHGHHSPALSKIRTHIDGVGQVSNESAWGEQKAIDRGYGTGTHTWGPPPDKHEPQHPENKHGPQYNNDTSGWVRGEGGTAENRPGYVPGYRAPHGEPGRRGGPELRPTDLGPHDTGDHVGSVADQAKHIVPHALKKR